MRWMGDAELGGTGAQGCSCSLFQEPGKSDAGGEHPQPSSEISLEAPCGAAGDRSEGMRAWDGVRADHWIARVAG